MERGKGDVDEEISSLRQHAVLCGIVFAMFT